MQIKLFKAFLIFIVNSLTKNDCEIFLINDNKLIN